MEKVTRELDWSCMSIAIDFKVKIMSVSALIILCITTPVQQLFEDLCSLYLKTYSCEFCNHKYKGYFKSLWLVNKQTEV